MWFFWRQGRKLAQPASKNIELMARTAWGEARGESSRGMQAVINVIQNRVKKGGWWGATVEDVVKKKAQFSCWNEGDPNREKMLAVTEKDTQFKEAVRLATLAEMGQLRDITGGATNYHAASVSPSWAKKLTQTAKIGNHIFYA